MRDQIRILEGTIFIEDTEIFLRKLKEAVNGKELILQAFDADKLAGKEHLMFAIEKATDTFKKGTNIANDLEKEIMLYAAGTRQINRALRMGVHKGMNNIVLVAIGEDTDLPILQEITPKDVLHYNGSKKATLMGIFDITEEEIGAVGVDRIPELVLERVALVDISK